ncbi:MAG: BON domain-containing protein [Syntrophaceae bacterium]|nr:BON domain-containing protein [Syntrophaceae bacterium]
MRVISSMFLMLVTVAMLALSVPAFASEMDNRIESTARRSYVFRTYLQADDIKVKSMDGIVALTGTVSEESHKSLAQETIAGLPGVKSVDNRLEVKGAAPTANSDAWIRDKVKATLLFHRSVIGSKTEINVKDGIVTLGGEATSQAQKDLTTEYVKDVEGVKDVSNEMTVIRTSTKTRTVGEKIDDASITAQVKMTLLYHRSTSALHTSVTTKRGVVTLSGKASNAAELNLATRFANDVNGVKAVKNQMTIE